MTKEFLEKYGKMIGGEEIAIVQKLSDDVSREKIAEEMGVRYDALLARIKKIRNDIGVKRDGALIKFFYENGLIR